MDENNWNIPKCPASRAKRTDPCRSSGSPRNRGSRLGPSMSRNPSFLDEVALNAMISSGMMESIGPVNFTQFRVPVRQASGYLDQPDSFGGHIDYTLSWMPKNINLANLTSQNQNKGLPPNKSKNKDPTAELIEDEDEPPKKDSRFLLPQLLDMEGTRDPNKDKVAEDKQETLLEWFDRQVEKELKKRKEQSSSDPATAFEHVLPVSNLPVSKGLLDKMSEATASRIEIVTQMAMEPDTELTDAVDKFAKAEAMCNFAGAVKAAEAAAEAAPPGFAEEAAVASARIFESELESSDMFHQDFKGVKPMEVVGYVGVTKPKNPVKPKK